MNVRVEVAVPPGVSLTVPGLMNQQYVEQGTSGVVRLIVPLKPLMLVRISVELAEEPAWTI